MFISLNSISPMAKAWEAWGGGGGNIIKLASSTGHDIVQVTGHAFTRVRTLIFFRYRSWDGYRPVSDFVDISLRARWGKLLLLEDYNRL